MPTSILPMIHGAICRPFIALVCMLPAIACGQVKIDRLEPIGIPRGREVTVRFLGKQLEDATDVWSNLPIQSKLTEAKATEATFKLVVPASAPVQIAALRVVTKRGISNLRLGFLEDIRGPTAGTTANRRQFDYPFSHSGTVATTGTDSFHLKVRKGQRISIDVLARRLGSPLDPLLLLKDKSGRELASSDDVAGLGGDCRLSYRVQQDGRLTVQVRDARYRGGDSFQYHLRVGGFPLAVTPLPLALTRGSKQTLRWSGQGIESLAPIQVSISKDSSAMHHLLSIHDSKNSGSAAVSTLISSRPEKIETEPNDQREQANELGVGQGMTGTFRAASDRDWFRIEGQAGKRLVVVGKSQLGGQATALRLQLYDAAGKLLLESTDPASRRCLVDHLLPATGSYFLSVRELFQRFGNAQAYRLTVDGRRARLALSLDKEHYDAPKAGVLVIKVKCLRNGYQGPIELSVSGLGKEVQLSAATIPKGKNETSLRITLPARFPAGRPLTFRVLGRTVDGLTVVADHRIASSQQLANTQVVPDYLIHDVALGVGARFPPFFKLKLDRRIVRADAGKDSVKFHIATERLAGFADGVAVEANGLPERVSLKPVIIKKGQQGATAQINGLAQLKPGNYRLSFSGRATFKNQPQAFTLADVPLRIGPAVELRLAAPSPLRVGKPGTLELKLERYTEKAEPITVALEGLPAEIKAPATIVVPAAQNRVLIPLSIGKQLKPGTRLSLQATADIDIKPIVVGRAATTSLAELHDAATLAKRGKLFEAEKFQRGNVIVDRETYGKGIGIISDPGDQKNFVEYDVSLPRRGLYQVELRYAAASSRPGTLSINGAVVKSDAMKEVTGSWQPDGQQWHVEGVFPFRQGPNVMRLEVAPLMSHIDKVLIVSPARTTTLPGAFDSWIAEGQPVTAGALDGNLISVFARGGLTAASGRRIGLIEFDVSGLRGAKWLMARLELGVDGRSSKLANGPASSVAELLPMGTNAAELNFDRFNKLQKRYACEKFGSFTIAAGKSRKAGQYEQSEMATRADLNALARSAAESGKLTIALMAREDGSKTARDWGAGDQPPKGTHGGPLPARLVVAHDGGGHQATVVKVISQRLELIIGE